MNATEEVKAPKHVGEEFPKLLYKLEPVPPDPPPPPKFKVVGRVVADKDEESKATSEGWSKDPPKIPEDKPAAPPAAVHTEHNDKAKK